MNPDRLYLLYDYAAFLVSLRLSIALHMVLRLSQEA